MKQDLLQRMEEMGISPKRSLGQNFLINPAVIKKIIEAAKSTKADQLIEIGPGLGALTEHLRLLEKPLRLFEMDHEFSRYWTGQGLTVIEGDALKLDWNDLNLPPKTTLVSNLPYQISARIVVELTSGPKQIDNMVLMFQREVADRLMGKPRTKDYGFLSVVAQLGWTMSKVSDAGTRDFFPPPRVLSRVLHFKRTATPSVELVQFVKKAFENRRKLMLKNFSECAAPMAEWLKANGLNEKVRAEELKPSDFVALYEVWQTRKEARKED